MANLPPSKGTRGLSSGGITGTEVKIIHSGLFPDEINDSINFSLFIVLSSVTFDLISERDSLNFFALFLDPNLLKFPLPLRLLFQP